MSERWAGGRWDGGVLSKILSDGFTFKWFHTVFSHTVYLCVQTCVWKQHSVAGTLQTHGSDQTLPRPERMLLWSGWQLSGSGSGVRKRREERLMASLKWTLSSRVPQPCLSVRGPLTYRGLPGTGRGIFFKASLLISLADPVDGSLSDGVARTATCFWPASSNSSLIHGRVSRKSQEASCRWKGPNRLSVWLNTQQISLSMEDMKRGWSGRKLPVLVL